MRVLEAALNAIWAMPEEHLLQLLEIAAREHEVTPEMLEAYRARAVANAERLTHRDNVGILTARGPMFRYANLFTELSGATSYGVLRTDLQAALDDPSIHAILLNVDSPGGESNGANELAKAIFAARSVKPIYAYVGGAAASAGYLLAAAAERVVIDDMAAVGSIGVRAVVREHVGSDKGTKRYEFVSSQTPNKGKTGDLETDEGRARVQRHVDNMAQVFIEAVAKYRGVTADDVLKKFGAGGTEIGQHAVDVGMADAIGTFESTLAELSARGRERRSSTSSTRRTSMSEQTTGQPGAEKPGISLADHERAVSAAREDGRKAGHAEGIEEGRKAGATQASARIASILDHEAAQGREQLARHLAFKTTMSVDDAVAALNATPKIEATPAQPSLSDRMKGEIKPATGVPPAKTEPTTDARERGRLIALRAKGKTTAALSG